MPRSAQQMPGAFGRVAAMVVNNTLALSGNPNFDIQYANGPAHHKENLFGFTQADIISQDLNMDGVLDANETQNGIPYGSPTHWAVNLNGNDTLEGWEMANFHTFADGFEGFIRGNPNPNGIITRSEALGAMMFASMLPSATREALTQISEDLNTQQDYEAYTQQMAQQRYAQLHPLMQQAASGYVWQNQHFVANLPAYNPQQILQQLMSNTVGSMAYSGPPPMGSLQHTLMTSMMLLGAAMRGFQSSR
jgi:hypothetical protein